MPLLALILILSHCTLLPWSFEATFLVGIDLRFAHCMFVCLHTYSTPHRCQRNQETGTPQHYIHSNRQARLVIISYYIISYIISYVVSCHVVSCHVMSCHVFYISLHHSLFGRIPVFRISMELNAFINYKLTYNHIHKYFHKTQMIMLQIVH